MDAKISQVFALLFSALLIASLSDTSHEEQSRKTMEEFSGYPAHTPHSCLSISPSSLSVDIQGLQRQIDELSSFSDSSAPTVTRILYSQKDVLARRYIKSLMTQAGLSVREDSIGNIFGRWIGTEATLPAVATGSHIDAIPYSGKYDGVIGVLGAIEAINVLKRSDLQPKRSLEVIMFTSEEPTRFGISCLGRNDAGLAAAELALAVEKHAMDSGSLDTVSTVGVLELHPGAINSIPSKAHIEIDTRDIDEERRNIVVSKIHQSAIRIAEKRGVKLSKFRIVNQDPPALSSNQIISTMEDAAKELNFSYNLMISRAYHDSLFMARITPMGMIFIPCYKGYSHKPEEYASPENIANGVKMLALTMIKLSSE